MKQPVPNAWCWGARGGGQAELQVGNSGLWPLSFLHFNNSYCRIKLTKGSTGSTTRSHKSYVEVQSTENCLEIWRSLGNTWQQPNTFGQGLLLPPEMGRGHSSPPAWEHNLGQWAETGHKYIHTNWTWVLVNTHIPPERDYMTLPQCLDRTLLPNKGNYANKYPQRQSNHDPLLLVNTGQTPNNQN